MSSSSPLYPPSPSLKPCLPLVFMPLSVLSQPKSPLPSQATPTPLLTSLQEEASQTLAGSASNDYFLLFACFSFFSPSCQYFRRRVRLSGQPSAGETFTLDHTRSLVTNTHWVLGRPLLPWSKNVKILTFSGFLLFSVSLIILINPLPHLKSAWPVHILLDLLHLTPVSANKPWYLLLWLSTLRPSGTLFEGCCPRHHTSQAGQGGIRCSPAPGGPGPVAHTHVLAGGISALLTPVSLAGILSITKPECQCSELLQLCNDTI